jgi:hypothetical protein
MLLAIATVVVVAAGGSAAGEGKARSSLKVKSFAPVTLAGESFRARERVVVRIVISEETRARQVRATRLGSFVTQFPGTFVHRCNTDFHAFAVGNRGSRAEAKLPQLQCPPRLRAPSQSP